MKGDFFIERRSRQAINRMPLFRLFGGLFFILLGGSLVYNHLLLMGVLSVIAGLGLMAGK